MTSNINEWERALDDAFEEKVVQRFVQFQRRIALEAFKEVGTDSRDVGMEHGSPVWTRRFAGSHRIQIGSPDVSSLPMMQGERWPDEPDAQYQSPSLAEASAKLSALKPFETIYISNSLPYARRLEGGYSPKAPEGVYGVTAERLVRKYTGARI